MATINSQIAHGDHDAWEIADGTVTLTDNAIAITSAGRWGLFFFPTYGLPDGATISSSIPEARMVTDDDPNLDVYVEKVASSSAPTTSNGNISGRTLTTAKVNWSGTGLGTADFVALPDIAVPLQEWADLPGRDETSNLSLIFDGLTGTNVQIRTYNFDTTLGLKLTTVYTLSEGDGTEYTLISFGTMVF